MYSSTAEKLIANRKKIEEQKGVIKGNQDEYRDVINRLFGTPDGKYFLNKLKYICCVDGHDPHPEATKLFIDYGKREIWFKLISPYLDKDILRELN